MGEIEMEFKIPKKFKVGGVDHIVKQVEHCGDYDNFGFCRPQGIIEIANQAGGYKVTDSKKDKKLDRRKRIKEKEERKFKKYHNKDFIEGEDYEDR